MEQSKDFNFINWIKLPQIYVPMSAQELTERPPRFNTTWRVTTNAELWKVVEHILGLIRESSVDYPDTLRAEVGTIRKMAGTITADMNRLLCSPGESAEKL